MLRAPPLSVSYTAYQSPKLQFYSPLSRLSCSLKAPNRKRCALRQPTFILTTTCCYSYFIIIYFLISYYAHFVSYTLLKYRKDKTVTSLALSDALSNHWRSWSPANKGGLLCCLSPQSNPKLSCARFHWNQNSKTKMTNKQVSNSN